MLEEDQTAFTAVRCQSPRSLCQHSPRLMAEAKAGGERKNQVPHSWCCSGHRGRTLRRTGLRGGDGEISNRLGGPEKSGLISFRRLSDFSTSGYFLPVA